MLTKPSACHGCPLEKEGTGYAPGEGPTEAKIVLIGEALGESEAACGRPFVGGTGQMLRTMLRQAHIDERTIYITNVVKCRPPGNRTPKRDEIEHCTKAYLWDELVRCRPNVIAAVGDTALRTILPSAPGGITDLRGSVFGSAWGKVVPIVHPSFVARGNPEYWAVSVLDLMHLKEESHENRLVKPNVSFIIDPTLTDIKRVADHILKNGLPFAFDIETFGPRNVINPLCIGFAWSNEAAICIPFLRRGGDSYWASEADEESAWATVGDLLSSPNLKITQNGFTFDLPVLMDLGLRIEPPVVDTLVKHHVVAIEMPHSLSFLTSVYTKIPYYKHMTKGQGGMLWVDDHTLRTYNLWDCIATYQANFAIDAEMRELGLE